MEGNQLFRKKSLDQISSPDKLDDYIKVSSPSVWVLLGAMIMAVVGGLVWGFVGQIPTTRNVSGALMDANKAVCFVPVEQAAELSKDMDVHIAPNGNRSGDAGYIVGKISSVSARPISESEAQELLRDEWIYETSYPGGWCCVVYVDIAQDAESVNGMMWASGNGAQYDVEFNQPATLSIITDVTRPIDMMLGI